MTSLNGRVAEGGSPPQGETKGASRNEEDSKKPQELEDKQEHSNKIKITTWRRRMGYVLMIFAALGIIGVCFLSAYQIQALTKLDYNLPKERFWLLVAGQTVQSFVIIYLLYQVLKASERLAIPYWWAERKPRLVRLMLGVQDMLTEGSRSAEQTAKELQPLVDSLGKLTSESTKLIEVLKPKGKADNGS